MFIVNTSAFLQFGNLAIAILMIAFLFTGPVAALISVSRRQQVDMDINKWKNFCHYYHCVYVGVLLAICVVAMMFGTLLIVPAIYALICIIWEFNTDPIYHMGDWFDNSYTVAISIVSVMYMIFLSCYFFVR